MCFYFCPNAAGGLFFFIFNYILNAFKNDTSHLVNAMIFCINDGETDQEIIMRLSFISHYFYEPQSICLGIVSLPPTFDESGSVCYSLSRSLRPFRIALVLFSSTSTCVKLLRFLLMECSIPFCPYFLPLVRRWVIISCWRVQNMKNLGFEEKLF